MGTEPHFNLGNYFFRALLYQGSDVEMWNYSGNVDIFVRFGPQVDPYFLILMPNPFVRVVESLVLTEEQRRCAAPHFHR
jgi:hypothetical protein